MTVKVAILRARKGVPGVGQRIANALGAYEVTCHNRPAVKLDPHAVIINYGRSEYPDWFQATQKLINDPNSVYLCVNKRETLSALEVEGVSTLEWSGGVGMQQARQWIREGHRVFCRTTSTGKQGNGIVIASTEDELVDAPLYTKEFKKEKEFRVHVAFGQVIDYVQKKRMGEAKLKEWGLERSNQDIRNHKRGWVFAHKDIDHDPRVSHLAHLAVAALGLDFGGVDILKDSQGNSVVCEVNSAPGMSSEITFNAYINAFKTYLNNI